MAKTKVGLVSLGVGLVYAMLVGGCGGDETTTSVTTGAPSAGQGAAVGVGGMTGTGGLTGAGGAVGGGGDGAFAPAGAGGSGGSGGDPCDMIPDGPFTPVSFSKSFDGSEDLAFDGKGNLAGKNGSQIVLLDSNGMTTMLAPLSGTTLGVRYMSDGNLLAARQQAGHIASITPGGDVATYAMVTSANGLFVDFDDNVWVARFGANEVIRIDKNKDVTSIVKGAEANQANGIVRHPSLPVVYYTEYSEGKIHRVDVSGDKFTPTLIDTILGAKLDGMVMDACGHLYIVDNNPVSKLYRLKLDSSGEATGASVEIAAFTANVANAQFGSGPGFKTTSLYAAGCPGVVWEIDVGVCGAAVPTKP